MKKMIENYKLNNAPETSQEHVKRAEKLANEHRPEKYTVDVFEARNQGTEKEYKKKIYALQSYSKDRLKKSMKMRSKLTKDIILGFGEIKPIKYAKD